MKRSELIRILQERNPTIPAETVHVIVEDLFDLIGHGLVADGVVSIRGFGRFEVLESPSRMRRNPTTGDVEQAPLSIRVRFSASDKLRKKVS